MRALLQSPRPVRSFWSSAVPLVPVFALAWAVACAPGCGGGSESQGDVSSRDVPCWGWACTDATGSGDAGASDTPPGEDTGPAGAITCTWDAPAEGALLNADVTLQVRCASASGVVGVAFAVDDTVLTQLPGGADDDRYEASVDTTAFQDGAHQLAVIARSGDGAQTVVPRNVALDNTGPDVAIDAPTGGERFIGTMDVIARASDPTGVPRLSLRLDGAQLAEVAPFAGDTVEETFTGTFDVSARSTGPYRLSAVAVDGLGNESEAGVDIRIVTAPRFRGSQPQPVGMERGTAVEMTVGDATGDGVPDLWFAGGNEIRVLPGKGDGTFQPGALVLEASTRIMRAADLDGDGVVELIYTLQDAAGPQVGVARRGAEGAWDTVETHALQTRGQALALGDLDGDERPDLLVGGDTDEDSLGILLALAEPGPPFFADRVIYSGGVTKVRRIVVTDFDGDGNADAAVGRDDDLFSVFPGAGDGTFGIARNVQTGGNALGVAAPDLREDGFPDLVATDEEGYAHVFLGEPDDSEPWQFGEDERPFPPPRLPLGSHEVFDGDFDGDGHADILVVNDLSKNAAVFFGDGDGGLVLDLLYNLGPSPARTHLADLNGDGRLDIVVLNRNVDAYSVALGRANGRFGAPPELLFAFVDTQEPVDLVAGDFLAAGVSEGAPDLVVVGQADGGAPDRAAPLWSFVSDGPYPKLPVVDGTLDLSQAADGSYKSQNRVWDARAGDVDGDQNLDLAVVTDTRLSASDPTHQVNFLLGDGRGAFVDQIRLSLGDGPQTIALCDVVGNGRPDVVVGVRGSPLAAATIVAAEVLLGPPPTLSGLGSATLTGDPADLQCARLDDDAANDFLTVNTTDGDLNYYKGTASVPVTQGERQALAVGEEPRRLIIADADGDGQEDVTASVRDNLAIAFGAPGGSTFETSTFLRHEGRGPWGVAVQDFTDDGFPDIAVANSADGTLSVYVNAGDRTFIGPVDFHTSRKPTELVAADFNGDGCADLAVLNATGRTVTLLLAEGARCVMED